MHNEQKWPDVLWIVRHGESAGNVARDAAIAAGLPIIDIALRDVDVPLSARGEEQASALGRWFGKLPTEERPTVVLTSPYLRARRTTDLLMAAAALERDNLIEVVDERLREKEFGVLDRLTSFGITAQYPEQAEFRRILGKFYHRPPGGESWCDVILRLRSMIDMLTRDYRRERVLIVAHQVVVLCLRYLIENLDEDGILAIDAEGDIANCGLSEWQFDPTRGRDGAPVLRRWNFVAPLEAEGAPVTAEPDAQAGAR